MSLIHCNFFGHNYIVSKVVTEYVKEYQCKHCKNQMTTSGNGNLIPLTPKFQEINLVLRTMYNKKVRRKTPIYLH